jgi:hypothetical protein
VNTSALNFTPTGGAATAITNFGAAATGNLYQLAAHINTRFANSGVSATVSGNTMKITGGTLSTADDVTESEAANTKANQSVAIFTSDGTISQSYNNSASDTVQRRSSEQAGSGISWSA